MSGYKRTTVSLSDEEYRKLHDAEIKLRFMDKELPRITADINAESREFINVHYSNLEKRQQDFQEIVADFNGNIQALENNTLQAINNQQEQLALALDEMSTSVWQGTSEILDQRMQIYENLFSQIKQENQNLLTEIINSNAQFNEGTHQKVELARSWIDSGYAILQYLNQNYSPNQADGLEISAIAAKLALAGQYFEQDMQEAAIMFSQEAYKQASELHIKLENDLNQQQVLRQACLEKARYLLELSKSNQVCPAIDFEGNELPVQIDINYWSNSKYAEITDQIKFILNQLVDNRMQFTIRTLLDLSHRTLPGLQSALEETLFEARLSVLNSQIRINIADLVVRALQSQGYNLDISNYLDEDMRAPYYAKVSNLDGSEVVVEVAPVPGNFTNSDLSLRTNDSELRTEHEIRQRAAELSKSLRQYGLRVGEIVTSPALSPAFTSESKLEKLSSKTH